MAKLRCNIAYSLLSSELIIQRFESEVVAGKRPHLSAPSALVILQRKLLALYFPNIPKAPTHALILSALEKEHFRDYPRLKGLLMAILTAKDDADPALLIQELRAIELLDWRACDADTQFRRLNDLYHYYPKPSLNTQALFHELVLRCRTMIVLFEENNPPSDTMCYDYAYKLMALLDDGEYGDTTLENISKRLNRLIASTGMTETPLHDVLLVKTELPDASLLQDLNAWRDFIIKKGDKALPFFTRAVQMEAELAKDESIFRAPKTLSEAKALYARCIYSRAAEDPLFASLCQTHKVSEERFNACLNYLAESAWPRKTTDNLPICSITGEEIARGLYWVKLAPHDKRALILGDITDCCQSIGGHSEPCVKDGISLSDNGFYVLLKARRKEKKPLFLNDGTINTHDFKIVAQSYAWRSLLGNLCLDSIELLRDEISDIAVSTILKQFAARVMEEHRDIKQITIGQGGKTPSGLFKEAVLAESNRQGKLYMDAYTQYCIAMTPYTVLSSSQQAALDSLFVDEIISDVLRDSLSLFCAYLRNSTGFIETIAPYLEKTRKENTPFSKQIISLLFFSKGCPTVEELEYIDWDALQKQEADACLRFVQEGSAPQLISQIRSVSDVTFIFRFMSAAQRISIAPYLYILDDVFQDVLACPDFIMANLDILFALTHESTEQLGMVLSCLSLEQRNVVSPLLTLAQSSSLIRCYQDFINLAQYFSTEQCAVVFERVQEKLLGDIQSSDAFNYVLEYLNTEQRTFVFERLQEKLPDMIQSSDNFNYVLKYLNTEQSTALCLAMKNKWADIIKYPHDLRLALSHLNLEQCAIIFAALKEHLPSILPIHIFRIEDVLNVLKSFSKEQCTVFCSVLKDKLLNIFYSGESIQQVLSALEPEQYAIMCAALKDTLISRYKEKILYIVEDLDKKNRLAFWDILIKILPDIVVSNWKLADILSWYKSAEQQTIIIETLKSQLPNFIEGIWNYESLALKLAPELCDGLDGYFFDTLERKKFELLQDLHNIRGLTETKIAAFIQLANICSKNKQTKPLAMALLGCDLTQIKTQFDAFIRCSEHKKEYAFCFYRRNSVTQSLAFLSKLEPYLLKKINAALSLDLTETALCSPSLVKGALLAYTQRSLSTVDSLVKSLADYRTRIAQHTREGKIDYEYGFWHHKQSQAINREGNALLAKKMAEMLASTGSLDGIYGTYDGVITSKETHSFKEALLIYRKALMYSDEAQLKHKPYFARAIERRINSAELNSIIDKWGSFELGTRLGV